MSLNDYCTISLGDFIWTGGVCRVKLPRGDPFMKCLVYLSFDFKTETIKLTHRCCGSVEIIRIVFTCCKGSKLVPANRWDDLPRVLGEILKNFAICNPTFLFGHRICQKKQRHQIKPFLGFE